MDSLKALLSSKK